MLKIGRVSAVNERKANVLFRSFDDAVTEELPVIIPYTTGEKAEIHVDDIVVVGYTKDGTGIVLGHL